MTSIAVAFTCAASLTLGLPGLASAAETHSNCIQFDPVTGKVISLTPNCSQTMVQVGGPSQSFPGANPCDPTDTGTVTITISRQLYHINVDGAGDAWDTGTTTGTLTFVPAVASNVSASGHFTNWFGDSFNARNMVQSSTFNASLTLSNGQHATMHEVFHLTFTPNGPAVTFDKPTGRCG